MIARGRISPFMIVRPISSKNFAALSNLVILSEALLICHPQRSGVSRSAEPTARRAESKDPGEVTLKVSLRDPSTALGMTVSSAPAADAMEAHVKPIRY